MAVDAREPRSTIIPAPLTEQELAATRRPVDSAQLLPPRVFHDPQIFEFEQESWFARTWICVAREADVSESGTYLLADIGGEGVIVVREQIGPAFADIGLSR